MDPGGSELDSSLPQPENPCLIVEDSQPDSVALEDDPESSYRALLARRLSSLQPTSRSPVLELISSPLGARCSQTDSQSEGLHINSQAGPGISVAADPSSAFQEESQVVNICPPPNNKRSESEDTDMDSRADSTTHCIQIEEGTSQFGFLELSQSQDLHGGQVNSREEEEAVVPQPDSESHPKLVPIERNINGASSGNQDNKVVRSEVSSSSSSEPLGQTGRQVNVQALLHSQVLQSSAESVQQDSEILSSQEDMFDADKSGAAVDSTVSETEQQALPTSTPAHTLQLLHLSGQDTLAQESLSQSSVDYVAPTPDNFTHTPLIVPCSPTEPENENVDDDPMDTSLPPEDRSDENQEEPMETDAISKPQPSASTPISQNSTGFVIECTVSQPSLPEFSHDVFAPTQSQDTPQQVVEKTASVPHETQPPTLEPAPFTLPLQLSENTESTGHAQLTSEQLDEDSQATQIEDVEEKLSVDNNNLTMSHPDQNGRSNSLPSESETAGRPKVQVTDKLEDSNLSLNSEVHKKTETVFNLQNVNVKEGANTSGSSDGPATCSEEKLDSTDASVNSCVCVQETSSEMTPGSVASQTLTVDGRRGETEESVPQEGVVVGNGQNDEDVISKHAQVEEEEEEEEGEVLMEVDTTVEEGASGVALVLSQSQLLSPEAMEEENKQEGEDDGSVVLPAESAKSSQVNQGDADPQPKTNGSEPIGPTDSASTNGHKPQIEPKEVHAAPGGPSQTDKGRLEPEGLKDKSLSDSSGDIPFHFTLPKDGELIGPVVSATPPLINQIKQTPRHSTPIEIASFSEKPDLVADVSADVPAEAVVDIVSRKSGEDVAEKSDEKLSLRMKLVTPVEDGSSERFSLQKPSLSDEDGSVVKVTTVSKAPTSPSIFTRVRQVHRQQEEEEERLPEEDTAPARDELFPSPQKSSQTSSLGCKSFPNSQSEPLQQEEAESSPTPAAQSEAPVEEIQETPEGREPPTITVTDATQKVASEKTSDKTITSLPNQRKRNISQQTSLDGPVLHSPAGRGEPATPSSRKATGPAHHRHVRTIHEVRTTITRIITDVYYEDGKEVDRKVTEETEEPVVECQVLDNDISPCRTGSSSMTSGDLGDISSLSSKASSLQHSSGGTSSSTATVRPSFLIPTSRGSKSSSPRRGGGQQRRGHRGQKAGSVVTKDRSYGTLGSRTLVPLSPRGRARRGRPPSRSSPYRPTVSGHWGGGSGSLQKVRIQDQPQFSSEDEPYSYMHPSPTPGSPIDPELPCHSDSRRSSLDEEISPGSSFIGLRVVAKWSSNGYFYSGRIMKDAGEGRFRLRFDDGYECEVAGKDILLCDPIPLETEVTALLEDEYFSIGVVKGHKTEGQELFYNIERDGQRQWYNRTSVILSLEQGNRLREQHSLGPYEPSTPLTKASDISLDNLVEGKRRRRVASSGPNTPTRSSSSSPRTPGPSGKRKLVTLEDERTPSKRGRRGLGARAAQRAGVCYTSGSGADLPGPSCDFTDINGPLPQNTSLFMGFAFMLTASSEIDRLTNILAENEEDDYLQTGPYNKGYTESQLQAGGGFILPDFNEEQCKAAYQSLLIADQHCRTRKYLLCLASGVPCVSHMWVRDCCKENKLLNYRNYLLPAGVGPDDTVMEWHPRCSPFKSLRVLLVFEEPVELWAQLFTMGGASSVRHFQADKDSSDIPVGKYDMVVTDRACPPLIKDNVTSQDIPLVSPEWLIQSMICGERLGFHSKPQYHHDYSS